jgi:hypothetical protein
MPARHRDHDSGSRRKLSTIRPYACPCRARISVLDDLESLDSISRNNQSTIKAEIGIVRKTTAAARQ